MNNKVANLRVIPFAMAAAFCCHTYAETPEAKHIDRVVDSSKVIIVNPDGSMRPPIDSIRTTIANFYVDQYRHFEDPEAPYFMFMSRSGNLAMGVGGVVRMRGMYDWNGSVPANGFAPYLIPVDKDPTQMNRLSATPAGTAIFFSIIGKNTPLGNYMGYIEANFNGYNHIDFKLKKAYVKVGDWTAGYASSTFEDPAALAPVIDGAGPNGKISKSTVLVRYFHTFKSGWSVAGGLEFPQSSVEETEGQTKQCADYLPDLVALGQYSWDGMSHIRASAMLRTMKYRNLIENRNKNMLGWGIQLSTVINIIDPLTVYAQGIFGRGVASYMGDLSIGHYDLVADYDKPGTLKAPSCLGITAGIKYNFSDNVFASVSFGEQNYYNDQHSPDEYKYGLYGALDCFWYVTPRFQVGAEYLIGKRVNYDHRMGVSNRVNAMFQLSF